MQHHEYQVSQSRFESFMYRVYSWMGVGLALTAFSSWYVSTSVPFVQAVTTNGAVMLGLIVAQFALVITLSFFLKKLSFTTAAICFLLYSVLTGIMLSTIFLVFTKSSIFTTFLITASMFIVMSIYGYTTKADLTTLGSFLLMVLVGLIVSMFANLFIRSTGFEMLISAVGVIVFTLLVAYDTQKIKALMQSMQDEEAQTVGKVALLGALTLYLDFINLFLFLLRFTGKQRD